MLGAQRTCNRCRREQPCYLRLVSPRPSDSTGSRELYAAHRISVLGYALRRTDNTDDAADVLAETFLTAWRRLDEVPPGDQAKLWLYGTARRLLANHRRGERRRLALADRLRAELAMTYRPPDQAADFAEIAAAFRRIPQPDQELLALPAGRNWTPARSPRSWAAHATRPGSGCTGPGGGWPPKSAGLWLTPVPPAMTTRTETTHEPDQPALPGDRQPRRPAWCRTTNGRPRRTTSSARVWRPSPAGRCRRLSGPDRQALGGSGC